MKKTFTHQNATNKLCEINYQWWIDIVRESITKIRMGKAKSFFLCHHGMNEDVLTNLIPRYYKVYML
jgi:hypothetical protein